MVTTLLQNTAAFAAAGAVMGLVLPHPQFPPRLHRAAEAAICSMVFGGAFAAGAGGLQEGLNPLAIAAGAAGVPLYLALVALFIAAFSRRRAVLAPGPPLLRVGSAIDDPPANNSLPKIS